MQYSQAMQMLCVFFGLVAAGPIAKRGAFTLPQVAVKRTTPRNGAAHLMKAYQKFHQEISPELATAATSGSVTATPAQGDEEYLVPVSVGCQQFNLDFDTGSSDLWVFSSQQSSDQTSGHTLYNPKGCSTSKLLSGASWSISYGDGSGAGGNVYTDKVVVGGVTATKQAVEAATSVSTEFVQDTVNNGLLGLAFSSINTVQPQSQLTFFDSVKSNLAKPLFAADLKYHTAGSYDFGKIDTSKFKGSVDYVSVDNSQGFWSFNADGWTAGDNTTEGAAITGIADTGTTLMLLDDAVVSSYYANIPSAAENQQAGGYSFTCTDTAPDFNLVINGNQHTVPGKYINFAANGDGTCFGGIQSNSGIGFSIFGDVFLKSQYVIFDSEGPQLGFANQQ